MPSLLLAFTPMQPASAARRAATFSRICCDEGRELRPLDDDRRIQIDDGEAGVAHRLGALREQPHRIGVLPACVGVGKARAEVPERRGAEQRVGDRMRKHVAVGVAERAALERNANAAEDQRAPLDEAMRVEPVADSHHPSTSSG